MKAFLKSIDAYQFWPVPSGYGRQGIDCYVCLRGKFVGIEVKAPGGITTARQLQTLKEINSAEGVSIVGTADYIIKILNNVLRFEE